MTDLPRAILFDLDDTILSAYARPEAAWLSVAEQFTDELAPLSIVEVVDRIIACSHEFWSDPERHRVWRQRLFEARRENVVAAFSELHVDVDDLAQPLGGVTLGQDLTACHARIACSFGRSVSRPVSASHRC